MRLFTALLAVPLVILIAAILAFPGGLGELLGLAAVVVYFVVMVLRASDWSSIF